jgi:hypothetical protein
MKINYILTKDDILVLYRRVMLKNTFFFKNYIFVIAIVASFLLAYYDRYANPNRAVISQYINNYWIYVAISSISLVIAIFAIRFMTFGLIRYQLGSKLIRLVGDKRLELLDNKIVFLSKSSKIEYPLTALERIDEISKYYFLITSNQAVIIIPKRAIGSEEFVKQLKVQMEKASN